MFNPKKEVFTKLQELEGVSVSQSSQNIFNALPAVTFTIQNNSVNVTLDNEIASQDIIVGVDVWAESSTQASSILAQVEAKMREMLYQLTSSVDVPNTDQSIHHIACSFRGTR